MPDSLRTAKPVLILIGLLVAGTFALSPLAGTPRVTRVSIVLLAGLLVSVAAVRPWRWNAAERHALAEWSPSRRAVWASAAVAFLLLFWFVFTRFRSGSINAVDFTVYFDRPMFQTWLGKPLFVETADDALRAQRSAFSIHAHWVLIPLAALYGIHATPLWLLALSVFAVVAGGVNVLRIVERLGGGGLVAHAQLRVPR